MAIEFQGETFPTVAAFQRAFPAYRTYADLVREGATTVEKIEAAIHERHKKARMASLKGARRGPAFKITSKSPK